MYTDIFNFTLPKNLIAQEPASPRDSSRLLEVLPNQLTDRNVLEFPKLLSPGDLLILNDTRVIPTRLLGIKQNTKMYGRAVRTRREE